MCMRVGVSKTSRHDAKLFLENAKNDMIVSKHETIRADRFGKIKASPPVLNVASHSSTRGTVMDSMDPSVQLHNRTEKQWEAVGDQLLRTQ